MFWKLEQIAAKGYRRMSRRKEERRAEELVFSQQL